MVCVCVCVCVCASAADTYRHMLNSSVRSFREGFPHLSGHLREGMLIKSGESCGTSWDHDPRQSANDTEPLACVCRGVACSETCHRNSEMVGSCMLLWCRPWVSSHVLCTVCLVA